MSEPPIKPLPDETLMEHCRQGSEGALLEVYHRYGPRIRGFVYRMTADADLAEEIFSSAFTTLLDCFVQRRPIRRLGPYLFQIARSKLMDELEARGRLAGAPEGAAEEHGIVLPLRPAASPAQTAEVTEQAELVRRSLAELPSHLREVVVLRVFEELDYIAIGEIVGTSPATVRSRMRYALQALRRAISHAAG